MDSICSGPPSADSTLSPLATTTNSRISEIGCTRTTGSPGDAVEHRQPIGVGDEQQRSALAEADAPRGRIGKPVGEVDQPMNERTGTADAETEVHLGDESLGVGRRPSHDHTVRSRCPVPHP